MRPDNFRHRTFAFILIGSAVCWSGCDGDNNENVPTVLPAAAFSLRTDLFSTVPAGAGEHFAAAAERLQPVATGFREHLDLAVAVAIASERISPSRSGDDFIWKATTDYDGRSTEFELVATPLNQDIVDWFLNVSYQVNGTSVNNLEIVRARSLTTGALGEWNHYASLNGTRTLVMTGEYGVVGLDRFVGVSAVDSVDLEIAGDSLEYSEFSGNIRELLWFDGDTDDAFFLQWDESTNSGWIVATDYLESAQSCWDAALANVDCE